jgi:hypothetical protein
VKVKGGIKELVKIFEQIIGKNGTINIKREKVFGDYEY